MRFLPATRPAPAGVGPGGGEVLPDQVRGVDRALACAGGAFPGSRVASLQARGAHQPPHPLAGHPHPAHDQLGPDPAHPGMAVELGVDLTDGLGELGVGALTLARALGPMAML